MSQRAVLVVDPNPLTHRRVSEALAGLALGIIQARDAVEAEQKAVGQDLALLLSSTALPRGNGYDLARTLRGRHPNAVMFLLAGGFEVYNAERAREAGVSGHIPKPFSAGFLRAHVEQALGGVARAAAAEAAGSLPDRPALPLAVDTEPADAYRPPTGEERIASFLPRDYQQLPLVRVDPDVVGPAIEKAIQEVLPEVVEIILRRVLQVSSTFRDLVEVAVDEAVRAQLPGIAQRVVRERLVEMEARGQDETDA